jgi:hypothetical protein
MAHSTTKLQGEERIRTNPVLTTGAEKSKV